MNIYTSYFAKATELLNNGIVPISIAVGPPKWWRHLEYKSLAPTWYMVKTNIGREKYIEEYSKILSALDPCNVLIELDRLAEGNDFALLCWEKPTDFCHRHLCAEWLMDGTGCEIKEYVPIKKAVAKKETQPSLFTPNPAEWRKNM